MAYMSSKNSKEFIEFSPPVALLGGPEKQLKSRMAKMVRLRKWEYGKWANAVRETHTFLWSSASRLSF